MTEMKFEAEYPDYHVEDFVVLEFADGSTLRLNSDDVLALMEGKLAAPMMDS
jgi:hypothetical protein